MLPDSSPLKMGCWRNWLPAMLTAQSKLKMGFYSFILGIGETEAVAWSRVSNSEQGVLAILAGQGSCGFASRIRL